MANRTAAGCRVRLPALVVVILPDDDGDEGDGDRTPRRAAASSAYLRRRAATATLWETERERYSGGIGQYKLSSSPSLRSFDK